MVESDIPFGDRKRPNFQSLCMAFDPQNLTCQGLKFLGFITVLPCSVLRGLSSRK